MLGYAALNLIEGLSDNIQWYQLEDELAKGKKFLDVRTSSEFQSGRLKVDTIHIPLNELRERLDELDKNQAYIVSCHSGLRSYIARAYPQSKQDLPSKTLTALIHYTKWLTQKE